MRFRINDWKRAPEKTGDVPIESGPKLSYRGTTTFPYNERAKSRIRHSAGIGVRYDRKKHAEVDAK